MKVLKFVAIDPAMSATGMVAGEIRELESGELIIACTYGRTITTTKSKHKQVRVSSDTLARCRELHLGVTDFLKAHRPDVVFAETPSGSQSASGAKSYGIACMLLASLPCMVTEVTPIEVKKAFMGNKTAPKDAIIRKAYEMYPALPWAMHRGNVANTNEHMADAVAIVHAGVLTPEFKRLINALR